MLYLGSGALPCPKVLFCHSLLDLLARERLLTVHSKAETWPGCKGCFFSLPLSTQRALRCCRVLPGASFRSFNIFQEGSPFLTV